MGTIIIQPYLLLVSNWDLSISKIVALVLQSSNHSVLPKEQFSLAESWHQQLSKKVFHFKKLHFTIHGKGIFFSYGKFFSRIVKLWSYGLDISSKTFFDIIFKFRLPDFQMSVYISVYSNFGFLKKIYKQLQRE